MSDFHVHQLPNDNTIMDEELNKKFHTTTKPRKLDLVKQNNSIVTLEIEMQLLERIYLALETASDNALEVYNEHESRHRTKRTKRDNELSVLLAKDLLEVEFLIKEFGVHPIRIRNDGD